MSENESITYGRKIFFINPPLSVETIILDKLHNEQYDAHVIKDYRYAKSVLRMFPDSICFTFIDDILSVNGWYNFLKSFEYDDTVKSVYMAAISSKIKPADKDRFIASANVPGGFVTLGGPVSEVFDNIQEVIHKVGAKGRRKCIRLDCDNETDISGYVAHELFLYEFNIQSLSKVAFICTFPTKTELHLEEDQVFTNVCLNIGRRTYVCSSKVFKTFVKGDLRVVIFTIIGSTVEPSLSNLEKVIWQKITEQFNNLINSLPIDVEEYAREIPIPKNANNNLNEKESEVAVSNTVEAERKTEKSLAESNKSEEKPEVVEEKPEVVEEKAEVVEEKSEAVEEKSEVVEEKAEAVEEKAEVNNESLPPLEDL